MRVGEKMSAQAISSFIKNLKFIYIPFNDPALKAKRVMS